MSDFSIFRGRRVLVTGSTGFKGSWLCAWLAELGAEVHGLALPPEPDAPLFNQLRLSERIRRYDIDLRDGERTMATVAEIKPELVLHLAAQALVRRGYAEPKLTFDTNVGGAVNLLEAVRAVPSIKALVFITSDKCYRNREWIWGYRENDELGGPDPYSASKAAAEIVFSAYQESYFAKRPGFLAATARAGNVIGGGDWSANRIVPDCVRALSANQAIVLRHPHSTRPWQHVLEPLSGYLTLAARLLAGDDRAAGAWNFGPDAENVRSVQALVEAGVTVWGGGRLSIEPEPGAPHEAGLLMLNNDKAKTLLGWRPRWSFEQALAHTFGWYKEVGKGADPLAITLRHIADYTTPACTAPAA